MARSMGDASKNGFLRAGELARLSGVSTDTLRHYERKGVLPKPGRSRNRYRQYPPEAAKRVLMIQRALAIGFTLDELAGILNVRDNGGSPCGRVLEIAAAKLAALEQRIVETIALRDELSSILDDWDAKLSSTQRGGRAALLESLTGRNLSKARDPQFHKSGKPRQKHRRS